MFKNFKRLFFIFIFASLLYSPSIAHAAWPSTADWNPLPQSGGFLTDISSDANASRDIIGDSSNPAAYTYSDGDYIYYRIRLNGDPYFGTNNLKPFGWGFLIDTDSDFADYEWIIMIDGISDEIYIAENTTKTGVGDPSDKAETRVWDTSIDETSGTGNFIVTDTGADIDADNSNEFFLDFRVPYSVISALTGISITEPIRYFVGSSNSAQTLSTDLVGTSLFTDMTDPVTLGGTPPTTAITTFVSDLAGTGDVTDIITGDVIFIKVEDLDQNQTATSIETVTVTITSPGGDSEVVTLTETSADSGIFTGSITTSDVAIVTDNNNLELSPIEIITVTYIDVLGAEPDLLVEADVQDTLTANHSSDLSLAKTVNNNVPSVGDTITYTITITNNGPSTATGIEVSDTFPTLGLDYVSNTSGGSYNNVTGLWTVASLANGASESFDILATVKSGTEDNTYNNSVEITASEQNDPVIANDTASVDLTVGGVDLSVAKTVNNINPAAGSTITYTLSLINNSITTATNITLTDILDSDLTYVSSTGDGTYNSGTGLWTVPTISGNTTLTQDITVTVGGGVSDGTIIPNTVAITSADQADPLVGNNTAGQDVTIGGLDLSLTKIINNSTPNAGEVVTYTLTITNLSSNTANLIEVTDTLPTGVTYSSDSGGYDSLTGIWTVGTLAGSASTSLTISATIDTSTAGDTIINSASITNSSDTDPVAGNDTDSASLTVKSIDLEVTKTVDNTAPQIGDTITYTITVTNSGTDTASGITVTDALPADLTYVSDDGAGAYVLATGLWTVPVSLTPASSATLNITVSVTGGTAITNLASITSSNEEDLVTGNDSESVIVYVGGTDIEVIKTVSNLAPPSGGTVTYTITLTNNGPVDATGIEVVDALPTGVSYSSSIASQGSYNSAQDTWTVGDILNGGTATLDLIVDVTGLSGDIVINTARLDLMDQTDTNIDNNSDTATIYIGGTDLSITKVVDNAMPTEGDTVVYTLTITNTGSNSASLVTASDLLPSGTTYVSDNGGGAYVSATGVWTVPGVIAASASVSLDITATINTGTGGSLITNTASITGLAELDVNDTNNDASISFTVQSASLYIVKIVDNATPYESETITYTLNLTNDGPNDATGVVATDLLPVGVTYVSDDGGVSYDNLTGIWTIGNILKNTTTTLNITATVDGGTGGTTITNSASITASNLADPNLLDNTISRDISPTGLPSITMIKAVDTINDPYNNAVNPLAIPGATVRYIITAINTGNGTADDVVISDEIPSGTKFCLTSLGLGDPITFSDGGGAESSGLTYNFTSLNDPTDDLVFYDSGGLPIATVTLDADGCDASVSTVEVNLGGSFDSDAAANPRFSITIEAMVL